MSDKGDVPEGWAEAIVDAIETRNHGTALRYSVEECLPSPLREAVLEVLDRRGVRQ